MNKELSIKETVLKELNLTDNVLVQWGTNKDGSRADITLADVIDRTISECEKRYKAEYNLIPLIAIALLSIGCGFLIGWALGYNEFVLEGREFMKEIMAK